MDNQGLCHSIYCQLLKVAEQDKHTGLLEALGEKDLSTTLLFRVLHLTMSDYHPTQNITFKYFDDLSKREIEAKAPDAETLTKWWKHYGYRACSALFIYNQACDTWVSTHEEEIASEIDSIFTQSTVDSLSSRIALIKALIKKLEYRLNYRFNHLSTLGYVKHRLRYSALLACTQEDVLVWAARIGAMELIEWMSQRNINHTAKKKALEAAVSESQWEVVKYLYQKGTPLGEKYLDHLLKALVQTQDIELITLLLESGLPNDQKNNQITTLLLEAMQSYADDIVKLCSDYLFKKFLNEALVLNDNLKKVLLCATQQGYTGVVKILLDAKMPVDTCNEKNQTLLTIAIEKEKAKSISGTAYFLQRRGASFKPSQEGKKNAIVGFRALLA